MAKIECGQVVEGVTDYFEGLLDADEMDRLTGHLNDCWACVNYLGEIRVAGRLMSDLPAERLSGDLESILLATYRKWAASVGV